MESLIFELFFIAAPFALGGFFQRRRKKDPYFERKVKEVLDMFDHSPPSIPDKVRKQGEDLLRGSAYFHVLIETTGVPDGDLRHAENVLRYTGGLHLAIVGDDVSDEALAKIRENQLSDFVDMMVSGKEAELAYLWCYFLFWGKKLPDLDLRDLYEEAQEDLEKTVELLLEYASPPEEAMIRKVAEERSHHEDDVLMFFREWVRRRFRS